LQLFAWVAFVVDLETGENDDLALPEKRFRNEF
jgi:hypothetical protein